MSLLFSHEMLFMRINNNLAKRSSRILKRTMDIFGSLAIITMLSPVLLYLYYTVKKMGVTLFMDTLELVEMVKHLNV